MDLDMLAGLGIPTSALSGKATGTMTSQNEDRVIVERIDEAMAEKLGSTVKAIIRRAYDECGEVAIAYSGGVDSTLLAKLAREELKENYDGLRVILAVSPLLSKKALQAAGDHSRELRLGFKIMSHPGWQLEEVKNNANNRCYLCKRALFDGIRKDYPNAAILDGTCADDIAASDRPGLLANAELGVLSPFAQAGITKMQIRQLALHMGLPNALSASESCLATRFEFGHRLDMHEMGEIEKEEERVYSNEMKRREKDRHADEVDPKIRVRVISGSQHIEIS